MSNKGKAVVKRSEYMVASLIGMMSSVKRGWKLEVGCRFLWDGGGLMRGRVGGDGRAIVFVSVGSVVVSTSEMMKRLSIVVLPLNRAKCVMVGGCCL